MDRSSWLKKLKLDCEAKYDGYAPQYWEKFGLYSNNTHLEYIREFLNLLPVNAQLLDAACGAGRYESFLLENGHSVVGIDQSQGMLDRARGKFPIVHYEKVGLQEIAFHGIFDGIICMDAMENVPPEDWPLVLGNFNHALKPRGVLYFTAETIENTDEAGVRQAFDRARKAGLPVVYGEWPDEEVYHYHPSNKQVRDWVKSAGYEILKDGNGEQWYFHLLARKQ